MQILVGNKSDVAETKRVVPYAVGKALADEYRIQFFETSAKENINVEEVRLVLMQKNAAAHGHLGPHIAIKPMIPGRAIL